MKNYLILCIGILCFSASAQTQLEMNEDANDVFKRADKELNKVYQNILVEYKSDAEFIKNLKASQRNWIKFRDSELNMKYPERDYGYYGSMHALCVSEYLEKLTQERINTLRMWLADAEEGFRSGAAHHEVLCCFDGSYAVGARQIHRPVCLQASYHWLSKVRSKSAKL